MSDPSGDGLWRGRELSAADLRVEAESGSHSLAAGLVYLGFAAWLAGPLRVLWALPSDLSTATAATFQPAAPLMIVGFVLVFAGGLVAIATSKPVVRGVEAIGEWRRDDAEPEPLSDGGDPLRAGGDEDE